LPFKSHKEKPQALVDQALQNQNSWSYLSIGQ
jgi:hypothetical protein